MSAEATTRHTSISLGGLLFDPAACADRLRDVSFAWASMVFCLALASMAVSELLYLWVQWRGGGALPLVLHLMLYLAGGVVYVLVFFSGVAACSLLLGARPETRPLLLAGLLTPAPFILLAPLSLLLFPFAGWPGLVNVLLWLFFYVWSAFVGTPLVRSACSLPGGLLPAASLVAGVFVVPVLGFSMVWLCLWWLMDVLLVVAG